MVRRRGPAPATENSTKTRCRRASVTAMQVFVTGGTGAVGGYAVPALIAAGHQVSAMARTDAKADVLQQHGATAVQVSLFDLHALTAAFRDHDAVVNLASALPSPGPFMLTSAWKDCHRTRIHGSATVVDAALAAGVPRVVQKSVAMIYRDGGHRWIDEDWAVNHYPIAAGIYGPGADHSEMIMGLARRHLAFQAGRPDSYMSSIHLADNARLRGASGWRPHYPSVWDGYQGHVRRLRVVRHPDSAEDEFRWRIEGQ